MTFLLTKTIRLIGCLALAVTAPSTVQAKASVAPLHSHGEPNVVVLTDYRNIGEADLCRLEGRALFTGTLELRHRNGTLIRRLACANGLKEGIDRQFYTSGTLRMERNWKAGALDGLYRHWTEDGVLKEQWTYGPDGLEGRYYVYHPNGVQAAFANYKNGKHDGPYADFDKEGELKESGSYVDGRADGEVIERTMYGGLAYRHFDHGRRVGLQTLWSKDGKILRLTRYTSEGRFVRERTWNTKGELIREYTPVMLPGYGPGLKMIEQDGCAVHTTIQSGTSDPAKLAMMNYSSAPDLYKLETITCEGELLERVEAFDHKLLAEPIHNGNAWDCAPT